MALVRDGSLDSFNSAPSVPAEMGGPCSHCLAGWLAFLRFVGDNFRSRYRPILND